MGKRYLIDTNVLIEYIGGLLPEKLTVKVSNIIDKEFNISFVNKIEILGHASVQEMIVKFIDAANIYYVDNQIVEKTISIRKTKKIKLPDALLAATAIIYGFTLLTRNVDDFVGIDDLKIENPWSW
jgi:predicted nucleic acid-binding protein